MTFSQEANLPATRDAASDRLPRLDDQQMNALAVVANAPLPALPPIGERDLKQSLAVLDSALPRRNSDDASGRLMLAAYERKLGQMPKEQFDHMCNAILERCRWFPTIAECLEIAGEWTRRDAREKARAQNLMRIELQARMDDALHRLRFGQIEQAEVDAWPDHWKQVAATRGDLYRDPERFG